MFVFAFALLVDDMLIAEEGQLGFFQFEVDCREAWPVAFGDNRRLIPNIRVASNMIRSTERYLSHFSEGSFDQMGNSSIVKVVISFISLAILSQRF